MFLIYNSVIAVLAIFALVVLISLVLSDKRNSVKGK